MPKHKLNDTSESDIILLQYDMLFVIVVYLTENNFQLQGLCMFHHL